MSTAAVESYVDSSVCVVTLCRGAEGNRLNPEILGELSRAIGAAQGDASVRALLIRSNHKNFCHGMDLGALRQSGWQRDKIEETVALYTEILFTLYTLSKPVVAVVQGDVKAGGVGLAAAADYLVGTETATFEMAEVFFGIIPANVLPLLQGMRTTPARARSLVLSARKLTAHEALAAGLLDDVVAEEALEKTVKDLFKRLCSFSPTALAAAKRLTAELSGIDLKAQFELTKKTLISLLQEKKTQEAIDDFLEGGMPSWAARFKPQKPLIIQPQGREDTKSPQEKS